MIFLSPEMRQAYIELHGDDKEGAKFRIGQKVVFNKEGEVHTGTVLAVNFIEDGVYEYLIDVTALLAWEDELCVKS